MSRLVEPSPTSPRLVSVGNILVDIVVRGTLPERGSDSLVRGGGMAAGGTFNALLAASQQGLDAAYGGAHGTGPFGDIVRAALKHSRMGILLEPTPDLDSGYDIAVVEGDGERSFLTAFGAEAKLTAEQLSRILLAAGDILLVSGYGLLHTTNGAVLPEWIAAVPREVTVLVDPGPLVADIRDSVWAAVMARANWLSCNEREARLLTGVADPEAAARILSRTSPGVLVRLGPRGCLLATAGGVELVPGFAVTPVDTNGAGDAHAGAFLAALAEGLTPRDAVARANACAAIAVTREGPATAPTRAEVLTFLE